ncbi:MAG: tetratricopeptide repeat protein [Anaerolineales bacterium]|nr:tetratricopeptide repeat protein [Anaerolineales bacterium]
MNFLKRWITKECFICGSREHGEWLDRDATNLLRKNVTVLLARAAAKQLAAGNMEGLLSPAAKLRELAAAERWYVCSDCLSVDNAPVPSDSKPVSGGTLNEQGLEALQRGAYAEAIQLLELAVSVEPQQPGYWNNLAQAFLKQGQTDKAHQVWQKVFDMPVEHEFAEVHARAVANMGVFARSRSNKPEMLRCFERALAIDPDQALALKELAVHFQQAKEWRQAITYLQQAIAVSQGRRLFSGENAQEARANLRDRLATCLVEFGDHAEAISQWQTALREKAWSQSERRDIEANIASAEKMLAARTNSGQSLPPAQQVSEVSDALIPSQARAKPGGEDSSVTRSGIQTSSPETQTDGATVDSQLSDERARWLLGDEGTSWLKTTEGRRWLGSAQASSWLASDFGHQWLRGQDARRWLMSGDRNGGKAWLRSDLGMKWLATKGGWDFLDTPTGRAWLGSGVQWLTTDVGAKWLASERCFRWVGSGFGQKWLMTEPGIDWLLTSNGQTWLGTEVGHAWQEATRD